MIPCLTGSSQRRQRAPLAINSAAKRVDTKLWEAQESQALVIRRPPAQIFRVATEPKLRLVPKVPWAAGARRPSHEVEGERGAES